MCVCVCVCVCGLLFAELDAAVLTCEGSFLTVTNDDADKCLHFLLAMAPSGGGNAQGDAGACAAKDGGQLVRTAQQWSTPEAPRVLSLFGHNGAVIATTAGPPACLLDSLSLRLL